LGNLTFVPLQHLRRKGLNPARDLLLLRELYGILRAHNVAVALNFTIKPVIYGSLAARLAGVRSISTLTGLGYTFISPSRANGLVRSLYRLALRGADTVFFHNPDDRALFLERGLVRKEQSFVVPGSGIDPTVYQLAPYAEAVPGRFLFVGRLLTDKGLREFVEAARLAKAANPTLTFHVLGPFDPGNPAGISAREFDLWVREGIIAYDGVATDIRPHLRRASVVVLPSYREGCPRVPGVREVVIPGQTGWLFPVRDSEGLAEMMLGVGDTLSALGANGRQLVLDNFSTVTVVEQYNQKIKEIINV